MFSREASGAVDAAFEAFGVNASYTPPGGTVALCRVIAKSGDRPISFGEGRPFAEGVVIEVRASDVAAPAAGGTFGAPAIATGNDFAGTVTIIGDPEQIDPLRLIWTCRVH